MSAAVRPLLSWVPRLSRVPREAGELEIDAPDRWRVRARLGVGHPFRQVAVVSAVLEDGTVVHGRGVLVAADVDGDEVVIEGTDGLD